MNHASVAHKISVDWQSSYRRRRKDEIVLCRVRISHTHLTHSYILKKNPSLSVSTVSVFQQFATVECNNFDEKRKDVFGGRDIVESFRLHHVNFILFKIIQFYNKF